MATKITISGNTTGLEAIKQTIEWQLNANNVNFDIINTEKEVIITLKGKTKKLNWLKKMEIKAMLKTMGVNMDMEEVKDVAHSSPQ